MDLFPSSNYCRRNLRVFGNLIKSRNYGLVLCRQLASLPFDHALVTNSLSDQHYLSTRTKEGGVVLPLYIYQNDLGSTGEKRPNLDPKIYAKIKKSISDVTPESLFDYIYAVLHAPKYRTRYAEFLKSDFPRIPYPENPAVFHALAEKGAELRELHLMESPLLDNRVTTYPVDGDHLVEKPRFEDGKVYINATQYFGNAPEVAWNFYIGGYQPAQKWLKDRKGRNLSIDDIRHYQRIIVALTETPRIMSEIDQINFLPEGN